MLDQKNENPVGIKVKRLRLQRGGANINNYMQITMELSLINCGCLQDFFNRKMAYVSGNTLILGLPLI